MTTHARSVAGYRSDTLEDILAGYMKKERKDKWDRERIAAIKAELKDVEGKGFKTHDD